jgi:ATP-dependent DNA ligase
MPEYVQHREGATEIGKLSAEAIVGEYEAAAKERRPDGIFVAPFEAGEIGPDLFRAACEFGSEGLVSKRRDSAYRSGRSPSWVKVKNRIHPAMSRGEEFNW